jgi:hypothetical protein
VRSLKRKGRWRREPSFSMSAFDRASQKVVLAEDGAKTACATRADDPLATEPCQRKRGSFEGLAGGGGDFVRAALASRTRWRSGRAGR